MTRRTIQSSSLIFVLIYNSHPLVLVLSVCTQGAPKIKNSDTPLHHQIRHFQC